MAPKADKPSDRPSSLSTMGRHRAAGSTPLAFSPFRLAGHREARSRNLLWADEVVNEAMLRTSMEGTFIQPSSYLLSLSRPTTSPTSLSESVLRIAQRECHRSRPEPEVSDLWKLIADTGAASDLVGTKLNAGCWCFAAHGAALCSCSACSPVFRNGSLCNCTLLSAEERQICY